MGDCAWGLGKAGLDRLAGVRKASWQTPRLECVSRARDRATASSI